MSARTFVGVIISICLLLIWLLKGKIKNTFPSIPSKAISFERYLTVLSILLSLTSHIFDANQTKFDSNFHGTIGTPGLDLKRIIFQKIDESTKRTAEVFDSKYKVIDLTGRDHEFNQLKKFLNSLKKVDIMVITGSGGSGKTRLAKELCVYAQEKKWDAGFVNEHTFVEFLKENLSGWKWDRPVLIVVDDANGYVGKGLEKWISFLENTHPLPAYRLRLVLVDRSASIKGGWLKQVKDESGFSISEESILNLSASPISDEDRIKIFSKMVNFFGSSMPKNKYENRELMRQLEKVAWGNDPLYIMMAAMRWTDVSENQKQTLSLNSMELAKYVAGIEKIRFDRTAKSRGLNQIMLTHLAAFVTLADGDRKGIGQKEFLDFLLKTQQALKEIIEPSFHTQRLEYFNTLKTLLPQSPNDDKRLHGILPDVIGETFVMNTIDDHEIDDQMTIRAYNLVPNGTLQTLIRMVQDFETTWPLKHLYLIFNSIQDNHEKLEKFVHLLPFPTQILAELRIKSYTSLINTLRPLIKSDQDCAKFINLLNNLWITLNDLTRHTESLEIAQEAVDLCDRLVHNNLTRYPHLIAGSYRNLGLVLGELDRNQEALEVTQRSVDLFKVLSIKIPDLYIELGLSLNNLGLPLKNLNRHREALESIQEAVNLFDKLAVQNPDVYNPHLAMSLCNLGISLKDFGDYNEAINASRRAVNLYRELASKNPDAYTPRLVLGLDNLGIVLRDGGRPEEALEATQAAVAFYEKLALKNPDVYIPELASGYNMLGAILGDLNRNEEALVFIKKSVDLYGGLASKNPDIYNFDLALAIYNLGSRFGSLGDYGKALENLKQSIKIYRTLISKDQDTYNLKLAMFLAGAATVSIKLTQPNEAFIFAHEALGLCCQLIEKNPNVHYSELAHSLRNLGYVFRDSGHVSQAIIAFQKSVDLYIVLFDKNSDIYYDDALTISLYNLGCLLNLREYSDKELKPAQEVVDFYRELAAKNPDDYNYSEHLASSLCNLGSVLKNLGRYDEALDAARDALSLRKKREEKGSWPSINTGRIEKLIQEIQKKKSEKSSISN